MQNITIQRMCGIAQTVRVAGAKLLGLGAFETGATEALTSGLGLASPAGTTNWRRSAPVINKRKIQ
jgi:hypothetical protein